jgi:hypothetical protein
MPSTAKPTLVNFCAKSGGDKSISIKSFSQL